MKVGVWSRWLAVLALLIAAACDSSSVTSSGEPDASEPVPSNRDQCSDDTECPYWRCRCLDGTMIEGGVCASYGCQNDSEVCADCRDHGGQGRTELWDPGDWPDDAAPTVTSGGAGTGSMSSSSGSGSSSGGASGSGSGSGASGAGAGSGSGSSAGQGGSAAEGSLCPQSIACARAGSTTAVYEYKCEGYCTGSGSTTLAPADDYDCRAFPGDWRPPLISVSGLEGVGEDVGSVGFGLQGYGGGQGVPWGLKPQQDCHAPASDDKIVVFDQTTESGGTLGVVLPVTAKCGERPEPEQLLVGGTFEGWVCADCPWYEDGEYFAAFQVAFNLTDDDVIASFSAQDTPKTKCTISGGASFGGCRGPACTNPDPYPP